MLIFCEPLTAAGLSVTVFMISDEEGENSIQLFLGFGHPEDYLNVDYTYEILKRISDKLLPIADAECGDAIMLSLSKEDYGAVYYWAHEYELLDDVPDLYRLADSFTDFLNMLQPDTDEE